MFAVFLGRLVPQTYSGEKLLKKLTKVRHSQAFCSCRFARAERMEDRFGGRSEYVLVKDRTNKPSVNVCDGTWRKSVTRAGLPEGTCFHTLRHIFVSWHMQNETPEMVIQQLGGWSNTAMLQRYVHIKDEQKSKAVQSFRGW